MPSLAPCAPRRRFGPALVALSLAFSLPGHAQETGAAPVAEEEVGVAGAFLAARAAASHADYAAAAEWYARALLAEPTNPGFLEGAVMANIGLGEFTPAANMARALHDQGVDTQISYLALLIASLQAEDYAGVIERSTDGVEKGALLDTLVTAWAQAGLGRMSEATETFDKLTRSPEMAAFGLYHKALALASAGDFEGADAIFADERAGALREMRRGVLAHVRVLSQLERNADALKLLDDSFTGEPDFELDQLRHRLAAGEPVPFDMVTTAKDGMAEVFYTLAMALGQEGDPAHTLVYARGAQALRPAQDDTALLVAGLLTEQGQHDLAIEVYAAIPADSPSFHIAEIGRAEATHAAGRTEASIEILQGLARAKPDLLVAQIALADGLRREERFDEARKAYDAAIGLLGPSAPDHWALYFSRGICAERLGDFDGTVADMREALRLNPDQAQVLNYLGYSYVDRGENLDEALGMIERAVAKEPGSGYIIDSLAWAYYRLGRYGEAVEPMERASLLEPVDPIVTDHLGDVYWAVGRTREAEFQWHRALSYGPEEKDALRIRAKIEKGLDAVLAEEGAKPIAPVEAKAAP
ncbi:tetratricopeptide repeat protein [Tabrizicola oligotrophica]|uniref:Tetratricopeptide repeat protein n=1 Tax=Tabrizicola oligotrophica TaxID=2710650 RepID=A0A6M0QW31_9RHOB|nr:tetratricopeptide repeat protein [Tabrizicola oligotrophica]NEY90883.1 tetratricopeptide repeat protein [Tabrizicola oligotrophica]